MVSRQNNGALHLPGILQRRMQILSSRQHVPACVGAGLHIRLPGLLYVQGVALMLYKSIYGVVLRGMYCNTCMRDSITRVSHTCCSVISARCAIIASFIGVKSANSPVYERMSRLNTFSWTGDSCIWYKSSLVDTIITLDCVETSSINSICPACVRI